MGHDTVIRNVHGEGLLTAAPAFAKTLVLRLLPTGKGQFTDFLEKRNTGSARV